MTCANHPDRENVAFCQNCGKPLCQECTRVVGSAVFCEPCLAAKLAGTGPPPAGGTYVGSDSNVNYTVSGTVPPPPPPGEPNPGLAALLGFIPGVGAMYNGQYAKGVVHLVVFAILVSLTMRTASLASSSPAGSAIRSSRHTTPLAPGVTAPRYQTLSV